MTSLKLLAFAALIAPVSAQAGTVGNDTAQRWNVDGAYQQTFVLNDAFATAGQRVSQFSFFGARPGTLTPLLFSRTVSGEESVFTIIGRGTDRTVDDYEQVHSFAFGLQSGTDITDASTYFGFANGGYGLVGWTYAQNFETGEVEPGKTIFVTEFSNDNVVGDSYTFANEGGWFDAQHGLATRVYSINATSVALAGAVPEPATWAMMIAGVGLVGGAMRRRKVATTVRFG